MGGGSSKPAFESARSVIARRQPVVKEVMSEAINGVTIIDKPSAVRYDSSMNEGYSTDALNTMGNWGDYVVSTSYQVSPIYPTISTESSFCQESSYNPHHTCFWTEPETPWC